ncbi:AraC family transcriptional regulator [Ferrovibrio sp.]|uniref:AraC family transcriptional regulator n=1 Tax=Ferrovibrio sp. TaxID=1917215 RepID=UPI0035B412A7
MDALSGLAPLLRVRPELQEFCRFGGSWQSSHAPTAGNTAQFHIVTRGGCVIDLAGQKSLPLRAGNILLLPHGDRHVVRARKQGSSLSQISTSFQNTVRLKETAGETVDTELVCGLLHFENTSRNMILATLPETIVINLEAKSALPFLHEMVCAIRDELDAGRPGPLAIASDLASALFTMLLRNHIEGQPSAQGMLALLSQPTTGRVVSALIQDPMAEWTLDSLAAHGGTSRATLVRAFRRNGGMAPLEFLTELRLGLAAKKLRNTTEPIARIAAGIGYQSEGAFSRAFLRQFGVRPGQLRADPAHKTT